MQMRVVGTWTQVFWMPTTLLAPLLTPAHPKACPLAPTHPATHLGAE